MKSISTERILLNVSGECFETRLNTLERFPKTLLGDRKKRRYYYCSSTGQYFFNRTRLFFDAILFYYQSNGILTCPYEELTDLFAEECRFFQIAEDEIVKLKQKSDNDTDESPNLPLQTENIGRRERLWHILQYPHTSKRAKYFAIFSMVMILLAVSCTCLQTIEVFKTHASSFFTDPWSVAEFFLNTWFLIEIILRIICTPTLKEYFSNSMNWVDIISVTPFFVIIAISDEDAFSIYFLRIMRFFRTLRLIHLSNHSTRLKLFCDIIISSIADFQRLFVCLGMLVILGGSIMFYLEAHNRDTPFISIPEGIYWGIQTSTTVGYGDVSPVTVGGKLFACCFMIVGVLTLCLPVLFIVDKFQSIYEKTSAENHV